MDQITKRRCRRVATRMRKMFPRIDLTVNSYEQEKEQAMILVSPEFAKLVKHMPPRFHREMERLKKEIRNEYTTLD